MIARLCAHQVSSAVSDRSEMGAWKFAGHFFTLLVGWTWYSGTGSEVRDRAFAKEKAMRRQEIVFFAENHILIWS